MAVRLSGIFTRDERAVVAFIAISLAVGSLLLAARRVCPRLGPGGEESAADSAARAAPEIQPGPLDLNRATESELLSLPGIGPARASAIAGLRASRGGFRAVDELLDVKGIGPRTLERIAPLVTVGPPGDTATRAKQGGRDP